MDDMIALGLDEEFRFSCGKTLSCFNDCCRDLNQTLTPYDILRLKTRLGQASGLFLAQYTLQHTGPETGLPIVTLKPRESAALRCPFVSPGGCTVYEDRPGSCRTYPLARVTTRSRETGKRQAHFALMKEAHCHGFEEGRRQTVRQWIETQGLAPYNEMNDLLMEIISLKNRFRPGALDLKSRHLFQLALYDLDNFRTHIFEKGLLAGEDIDPDLLAELETDDRRLLEFGIEWIKRIFTPDQNF
jgi:Fe-S-cluster containining protein